MNDSTKIRVTMTFGQLWHLFVTMEGIVGAGSENEKDGEIAELLARLIHRRGVTCDAIDRYMKGVSR